jgi:hypothetical protein
MGHPTTSSNLCPNEFRLQLQEVSVQELLIPPIA